MSAAAIGILVAGLVDIVVPLSLAVPLIVFTRRHRRSAAGELRFWVGAGIYLAFAAFAIWRGLVDVFGYEGGGVIGSTIVALPTSLVPAVFNSIVIHHFFTTREWAQFGYFAVLTVYVSGLAAWALLNALLLRALVLVGSSAYERGEARARLRDQHAEPSDSIQGLGI
jgi:hypothetical protein